jgi:predicted nucleic acid-binding protein
VTYLLEVNVLIALVHRDSVFHSRISRWIKSLDRAQDGLAFCALSELGVVRILPQLPETEYSIKDAQHLLMQLKAALQLPSYFLSDDLDAQALPAWTKSSKQTTDGHLAALAKANGAALATLDQKIPGAFLIPS